MIIQLPIAAYAKLIRLMLGGDAPKPLEEMRWEDDGGPPFPEWEHTITPAVV